MEPVTFGLWAKRQRVERGWSLAILAERLAEATGKPADPSLASRVERGAKTPGLAVRDRYHKVFGTSDKELIELGIVVPLDEWGRPIRKPVVPSTVDSPNVISFHPDDERYRVAEALSFLDPKGPDREATLDLLVTLDDSIRAYVARFNRGSKRPALVDSEAQR